MGMSTNIGANPSVLLQEERSSTCPECGRPLGEDAVPRHLISEHGYVDLAGIIMPSAAARTCLWDRVFATGDVEAHDHLCQLLAAEPVAETGRPPYVVALEAELLRRADAFLSSKPTEFLRLGHCLRRNDAARGHFWLLLDSSDQRVRELGRRLILPGLTDTREWSNASTADVERLLDKLCPVDDVWIKIRVCQRLPQFGIPTSAVGECLEQLRKERPIACPECSAVVPQDKLESHLRLAHHIYQFRGVRRPLPDLIATLFSAVCDPTLHSVGGRSGDRPPTAPVGGLSPDRPPTAPTGPDHEAWEALQSLARDEYGSEADAFLARGVIQAIKEIDPNKQAQGVNAAAEVIAASGSGPGLVLLLATSTESLAPQLALTLAALLPAPLSGDLVEALRPLLTAKRAPEELQIAAAAALLRTTGREGPAAVQVVNALVARGGKSRSVDRLNQLEEQAGPCPLIAERRAQIESRIRMRCPRCGVQLRRRQMSEHLWSEHALLLDGRRVREPWRLVDDWIAAYRQQGNTDLLVRCRALGQHLDHEHGLHRVCRLLLAAGIADADARRTLLAQARQHRASLCPRCFSLVPMPDESMPRPLNQSRGRLSLDRFCVDVSEMGLVPRLTIAALDTIVYHGREPGGWWLTRQGATLLLAGPPVVAALGYAVLLNLLPHLPTWPVTVFLGVALAVYLAGGLAWWLRPRPLDRSVNYAWSRLVPRLCTTDVTAQQSAFLAGLALTSINRGRADARQEQLDRVLGAVKRAVAAGTVPLAHFAALQRLAVADAVVAGRDPVPLVVDQVSACFEGRLPLAYAQWLLAEWEGRWWTAGNLARLRVLLCDRAFEAGWEIADLAEAGILAPALGDVVDTTNLDGLARLRLLWSLRPRRPWPFGESVITVFEVAEDLDSGRAWLRKYPDLLLLDEGRPAIIVCGRGVVFQETVFTESPRTIDIKKRRDFDGVEYELMIGEHRFRLVTNPEALAGRLVRWFRYVFGEFLPQVAAVHTWKAPEGSKSAKYQEAIACPECRRLLLALTGQVGRVVDGTAGTASLRF